MIKRAFVILGLGFVALAFQNFSSISPVNPVGFMMLSTFQGEPYSEAYLNSVLPAFGKYKVSGIVYESLGLSEKNYLNTINYAPSNRLGVYDQVLYNETIYAEAKKNGANLWLQIEVPTNFIQLTQNETPNFASSFVPGTPPQYPGAQIPSDNFATLTYEDIMGSDQFSVQGHLGVNVKNHVVNQQMFLARFGRAVSAYANSFPNAECKIILFEEETPYHAQGGGGLFWAGSLWSQSQNGFMPKSQSTAKMFAHRFSKLYSLMRSHVSRLAAANPNLQQCQVGVHIGHQPVYMPVDSQGTTIYTSIIKSIAADGAPAPDFTFYDYYYDLYAPTADLTSLQEYEQILPRHVALIRQALPGKPVYHLAQMHTANAFLSGYGRTPTLADLQGMYQFWQNGVDGNAIVPPLEGVGFYGKNASLTNLNLPAYDPNTEVGTVFETSTQRWWTGLAHIVKYINP